METPEFLPLGSVLVIRGNTKKIMITARGLALKQEGVLKYFDYGGCLYPEGVIGDTVVYFNHNAIQKVFFEGYVDDDNQLHLDTLRENLKGLTIEKGDPPPYQLPV